MYIVDIVKHAIKDPITANQAKFNALYLLKELMKSRNRKLVNYVEKKLEPRLEALAMSDREDRCLLEFNRNSDPVWSANFHYLNRECFQNWGELFRSTNPTFLKTAERLKTMKRLPVGNKFYEQFRSAPPAQSLPGGQQQVTQNPTQERMADASPVAGGSLKDRLSRVQQLRKTLSGGLVAGQARSMEDAQFTDDYQQYVQAVRELENDPQVKSLLNNNNPRMEEADRRLGEDIGRETVFVEQLSDFFANAHKKSDFGEFLFNYEQLYNVFFEGERLNLAQAIRDAKSGDVPLPPANTSQYGLGKEPSFRNPSEGGRAVQAQGGSEYGGGAERRYDTEPYKTAPATLQPPGQADEPLHSVPDQYRPSPIKHKDDSYEFNIPNDLRIAKKTDYSPDDFSYKNLRSEYPELIDRTNAKQAQRPLKDSTALPLPKAALPAYDPEPTDGPQRQKIDQLFIENEELKKHIEELEKRKRDLKQRVDKFNEPSIIRPASRLGAQPDILNPSSGAGFFKVLKNKDDQIDRLAMKISRLEKEYQRMSMHDDSADRMLNTPRKREFDEYSVEASLNADVLGEGKLRSVRKLQRIRDERQRELTGTVFVDQMYRDINRLLNKPAKSGQKTRDLAF